MVTGLAVLYMRNTNEWLPLVTLVPLLLTTFPWKLRVVGFAARAGLLGANANKADTTDRVRTAIIA